MEPFDIQRFDLYATSRFTIELVEDLTRFLTHIDVYGSLRETNVEFEDGIQSLHSRHLFFYDAVGFLGYIFLLAPESMPRPVCSPVCATVLLPFRTLHSSHVSAAVGIQG